MDDKLPSLSLAPTATKKENYQKTRHFHFSTVKDPLSRSTQITKTTLNAKKTVQDLHDLSNVSSNVSNQLLTSSELESIKISSKAFSSIIKNCSTYKKSLVEIKRVYDNYLDELLRSLQTVHTMEPSVDSGHEEIDMKSMEEELSKLTDDISLYTKENTRLQEEWDQQQVDSEDVSIMPPDDDEQDYAYTVNQKQYQLYKKHEEMQSSMESRSGLVPCTVCQRLEQCIRSNELELQKLTKNNKRLQQEIQIMEGKLQQYLQAVQSPSNTVSEIWKSLEWKAQQFTS